MPKAIILAGGLGTRLNSDVPKPLIDINGRTLTEWVMDGLRKVDVNDIVLSVCYKADMVMDYFGDGKKLGFSISYAVEHSPMGTAGPLIVLARMNKRINEPFFMLNGDNLFKRIDLNEVMEFHNEHNAIATIVLSAVKDTSVYGVARLEGNQIVQFVEKPKPEDAPSNLVNAGYYVLSPEVFDIALEFAKQKEKVMMERDIFPKIASMGRLYGFFNNHHWQDTGTPELLQQAREKFK